MYKAVYYSLFRNRTFVQFFKHFLELIKAGDPEILLVKEQYGDLLALVTVLFELTQSDKSSEISQELVDLDAARDETWSGLDLYIQAYTHHADPVKREAAQTLEHSLIPFGTGIARLKYVEETNTLNGIIDKWERESKLSASVTAIGVKEWVAKLKDQNTLFDTKFQERVGERADASDVKSLELRKQIIASYRNMLAHLQAHTTLSTDGAYDKINQHINELIDEYNKMIPKKEEKETEETPAEESAE